MPRPLTPAQRRAADRMRRERARVDDAEQALLHRMIAGVRELRGEVLDELGRIAPQDADGWRASHLKGVQGRLEGVLGDWADRLTGSLNDGVAAASSAGHGALAAALRGTAGEDIARNAQESSGSALRRLLERSFAYNADLVAGVADAARAAIMGRLRRGLTGQRNPVDVMRDVQRYLDTPARPTERFGGLAYQAERVVRTEMSRMYELSNRATMDATADTVGKGGGLQVLWLHSVSGKGARPAHVALDGETVAYGDTFDVNGHAATGPHDSSLPAEEVVNCQCTSTMTSPAWGVDVAAVARDARAARTRNDDGGEE